MNSTIALTSQGPGPLRGPMEDLATFYLCTRDSDRSKNVTSFEWCSLFMLSTEWFAIEIFHKKFKVKILKYDANYACW